MSLSRMKYSLSRVMEMLRTDYSYMKRLLGKVRENLRHINVEKLDDLKVIVRVMRLHADYVIDAQHPIEEVIYKSLQDRRPILASTIDKMLMEHAISESWLLAMRDLYSDDELNSLRNRKHFVTLGLRYCDHKMASLEKASRTLHPAIEVIFDAEDWKKVEARVDQIFSNLDDLNREQLEY